MTAATDRRPKGGLLKAATYYQGKLGFVLTRIAPGSKGPNYRDWNRAEGWIDSPEKVHEHWGTHPDHGVGVVLGPSGLCSLDVDHREWSRLALGEDLERWTAEGILIEGTPGRVRVLFRAPEGVDLQARKLQWADPDEVDARSGVPKNVTVFELRAGAVQDVLPPSVHPGTKKPYRYLDQRPRFITDISALPLDLLKLWQHWDTEVQRLQQACPWADQEPLVAGGMGEADSWSTVRAEIRARADLRELAEAAGATFKTGRNATCPFHEESHPSFWIFDAEGGSERWCCAHGGAPVGVATSSGYSVGDAIDLHAHVYGLTIGEATRHLAAELGVEAPAGGFGMDKTGFGLVCGSGVTPYSGEGYVGFEGFGGFVRGSVEPFPIEALPPGVEEFVREVAAVSQVPLELPGCLALGVLSAAACGRAVVRVGKTHSEPLGLYIAVAMPPGARKSSVFRMMAHPVMQWETNQARDLAEKIRRTAAERDVGEKRIQALRAQAAKMPTGSQQARLMDDIDKAESNLPELVRPPRIIAQDVTPEKLATLLSQHGGKMAILDADGGGIFEMMAGRYNDKVPNIDVWLKAHAGDLIRVDRVNRASEDISDPALTAVLAVQPTVVEKLSEHSEFQNRGLVARFLFSFPESNVGSRRYTDRSVSVSTEDRYFDIVTEMLYGLSYPDDERLELTITGDALEAWTKLHDEIEKRLVPGQRYSSFPEWASKLPGAVARIATILHIAENIGGGVPLEVSRDAIERAGKIGYSFAGQMEYLVWSMAASAGERLARDILAWGGRRDALEFSERDAKRAFPKHRGLEVEAAIRRMVQEGLLEALPSPAPGPKGGRPRSPRYRVTSQKPGQNRQNPGC